MRISSETRRLRRRLATATVVLALGFSMGSPAQALAPLQPATSVTSDVEFGPTTSMAKWLAARIAGAALGKGEGFVLDAIGFPNQTSQKLDELSRKLDQLSLQITDVQNSVNDLIRRLDDSSLKDQITKLREKNNSLNALYKDEFIPVAEAAKALAKAKEDGEDTTEPQRKLDTARDRFYSQYDKGAVTFGPMAKDIHDYLVPGPGNSILAAQGRTLLNHNRYLNSAHSKRIRALYNGLADQQSMAVWMHAERNVVFRPRVYQRIVNDYEAWHKVELENLPPQIPANTVVDIGRKTASTTQRAQMWLPGSVEDLTHRPPYQGRVFEGNGTVALHLKEMNQRGAAGFSNWRVPTAQQFTGLYSGLDGRPPANTESLASFLRTLDGDSVLWRLIDQRRWSAFFTGSVASRKFRWVDRDTAYRWIDLPVYTAVQSANLAVYGIPVNPPNDLVRVRNWSPFGSIDGYVDNMFVQSGARGGVVATRDVGITRNAAGLNMDYMAQIDSGVTARAVQRRGKLRVKVTPSLPRGSWKVRVQKRQKGKWGAVKVVRTRGRSETRTMNLPRGTYRVVVRPAHGCTGSKSKPVRLRR